MSKKHVFTLVSCSAYFSTLKMEAICSSETSLGSQRTTRRYIPEDGALQEETSIASAKIVRPFVVQSYLSGCYGSSF
jgi:hypothetical protein